jgi:hypothetical protein
MHLRELRARDPGAATALAIDVVARERVHRVLEPALEILAEAGAPAARPALRARFIDLTENGMRHDQDCALRVEIIRVLRAIGSRDDRDVAEIGVRTIQLNPPARVDVAQGLRAESLLLLSEIEPERADIFAVELLQDRHTSSFSGEPAVTAIRVLAARGQTLPIWIVARSPELSPDVLAQAFAALRQAPRDLQLEVLLGHVAAATSRRDDGDPLALVAAEAIVLNHLADGYQAVVDLLKETTNLHLCRYLTMTSARSRDGGLRALLVAARDAERNPDKIDIFDAALE